MKANKQAMQENLIRLLNPKIRDWANYHKGAVAKVRYAIPPFILIDPTVITQFDIPIPNHYKPISGNGGLPDQVLAAPVDRGNISAIVL